MFLIRRNEVFDRAQLRRLLLHGISQCDRGEDGERSGLELDDGGASTELDAPESEEWYGEGDDVWSDVADYHDLRRVRGYKLSDV